MGICKTFESLGPSDRAIFDILWRNNPARFGKMRKHHPVAYMTAVTIVRAVWRKGFITRQCRHKLYIYTTVLKAVLLHAAFERQLTEPGATAVDRAHIVEARKMRSGRFWYLVL
jgi:predicted transcriptional regulator